MQHVSVYGAGAAGLMAAEVLAKAGLKVAVHDHRPAPARKFLMAGRGGLNLTHSEPLPVFLSRYGETRARLEPAINAFSPQDVIDWANGLGAETFVGSSGRVFPKAMKASPLLRAWLTRLGQLGVTFHARSPWQGFDGGLGICAFGGASWPHLGSDANWVGRFRGRGITVNEFRPSNGRAVVAWSPAFADRYAGTPLKTLALSYNGHRAMGEIVISRQGVEGGAIYALSRFIRDEPGHPLIVDLKPGLTDEHVAERLARPRGKLSRANFLRRVLKLEPAAVSLMRETGAEDPKRVAVKVQGLEGLARAISSVGGVSWQDIGPDYGLRAVPGWFVAGEMIDWEAPTGGYLLQACFSTGVAAARGLLAHIGNLPLERHNPPA